MKRHLIVLALCGCGRDAVSVDRCVAFYVRSAQCESPNHEVTEVDRARLRGAYCPTEADRAAKSLTKALHCLETSTCEAFEACRYPNGPPHGFPH